MGWWGLWLRVGVAILRQIVLTCVRNGLEYISLTIGLVRTSACWLTKFDLILGSVRSVSALNYFFCAVACWCCATYRHVMALLQRALMLINVLRCRLIVFTRCASFRERHSFWTGMWVWFVRISLRSRVGKDLLRIIIVVKRTIFRLGHPQFHLPRRLIVIIIVAFRWVRRLIRILNN